VLDSCTARGCFGLGAAATSRMSLSARQSALEGGLNLCDYLDGPPSWYAPTFPVRTVLFALQPIGCHDRKVSATRYLPHGRVT
jgi:hypothetical protein